jgi:hypothetical protein
MKTRIYLVIGILFIGVGIAVWYAGLLPNIPSAGYLRFMVGLVLVLMGIHRCALAFFPNSLDHQSWREKARSQDRQLDK